MTRKSIDRRVFIRGLVLRPSARIWLLLLCLCVPALHAHATSGIAHARQIVNFNPAWRFSLGDIADGERAGFDDSSWEAISLPHSFSEPYFGSPDFYVGYGWYRKHYTLSPALARKHLSLEFEAAFQDAEVFVNGVRVGAHKGGYTGFAIDVTAAMHPGENLIAVRLNNLWNPRLAPRAGEHTFSGGIYRNVQLVATDAVHIAWCGVAITLPRISETSATVSVKTEVVNSSPQDQRTTVRNIILDAAGRAVATLETTQTIAPHAVATFDQTSSAIANPRLWHPDHPYLYSVKTLVLRGKEPLDDATTPLGMRWFQWTADKGFFLNGEHLYLRGANVHQDHAGWGDAVTDAGFERDVKLVKQAGFNFIRGSHYPHAAAFADACDRQGVLLWSENSFWGIGGFKQDGYWDSSAYPPDPNDRPAFEASVKQELAEMIRIHRNHPSIVAWSMGNETFFSSPPAIPSLRAFLSQLVAYTHELDPTRPAAIGGAQRPLGSNRIDLLGDVAGYNGDGSTIAIFQNPGVANIVSEYGSTSANRPGEYAPGWGDLEKDHGKEIYPWRSGQVIWCAFDHGSIAGTRLGKMGIVDLFRIPKRSYYWYRNEYAHIPPPAWPRPGKPARLKIEASATKGIQSSGHDDVQLTVSVLDSHDNPISNSPPVKFSVVSGPGQFPTGQEIEFAPDSDISILDGVAAIEFRSYNAGITRIRATSPGLEDAEIALRFDGAIPYVEGVTPHPVAHAYVRYQRQRQATAESTFGMNNPTHASSVAGEHVAGMATDGDPKTFWQAAERDVAPEWMLDMERSATLSRIEITFPEPSAYLYTVEVSRDQKTWTLVANHPNSGHADTNVAFAVPAGSVASYVRIRFLKSPEGKPFRLGEVRAVGVPFP